MLNNKVLNSYRSFISAPGFIFFPDSIKCIKLTVTLEIVGSDKVGALTFKAFQHRVVT